jgi:hypothetical protein
MPLPPLHLHSTLPLAPTCTCTCAIASPSVLATMYPRLCNCPILQPAHGVAPIQPHRTSADMKPGQPKHSHGQSARPIPSGSPFAADQDPRGAYAYPSCYSQGHLAHPEPTDSLRPAALPNTIPTFTTRRTAPPCLIPPQSPNPPLPSPPLLPTLPTMYFPTCERLKSEAVALNGDSFHFPPPRCSPAA